MAVAFGNSFSTSSASNRGRNSIEPPAIMVTLVATNSPWVWYIGSACSSTSRSSKRHTRASVVALEARLRWVIIAPLERPVVPEV